MHHSFLLDITMLLMFTYHIYTSSHQFIYKHTMGDTNKIGFTQNENDRGVTTIFFQASIKKQSLTYWFMGPYGFVWKFRWDLYLYQSYPMVTPLQNHQAAVLGFSFFSSIWLQSAVRHPQSAKWGRWRLQVKVAINWQWVRFIPI